MEHEIMMKPARSAGHNYLTFTWKTSALSSSVTFGTTTFNTPFFISALILSVLNTFSGNSIPVERHHEHETAAFRASALSVELSLSLFRTVRIDGGERGGELKFMGVRLILVTINPAMVIGPLLQPILNTSAAAVLNVINGKELEHFEMQVLDGWINVNDVANAHIQAFERPTTSGRYCLVERVAHFSEVVRILCELYNFSLHFFRQLCCPAIRILIGFICFHVVVLWKLIARFSFSTGIPRCADEKPFVPTYQVSKGKAKSLGVEFIPLDVSLEETVESL
ncbi:hypothetical protein DVH24_013192 [Malus domestica]|uniref:Uncharacterized protein n=1 Tax=Malus domestica TaxID=3750 RepID=A0A498IPH3_MALDO|nr:hypothetical protein DVH24_013192 [Malus domestica]